MSSISSVTLPGVTTSEGTFTTDDGVELYSKTYAPSTTPPKARVVFVHGFSDHSNSSYNVLFSYLAQQGITVYAYDQRGWGRNVKVASDRGNTGPNSRIMDDLTCFIRHLPGSENEIPLFLFGHSMGGGIILWYSAHGPAEIKSRIRGYLADAPFIKLHPTGMPWKSTVILGRLMSKVLPRHQLVQKFDAQWMCRDEEVVKDWVNDELCHDTGTLEMLAAMLDRAGDLEEGRAVVKDGLGEGGKTRLWIGFGTADRVLSYEACKNWFVQLQVDDKEFRSYEGFYHKLHAEPNDDKWKFAKDVSEWILNRLEATTAKAKL